MFWHGALPDPTLPHVCPFSLTSRSAQLEFAASRGVKGEPATAVRPAPGRENKGTEGEA